MSFTYEMGNVSAQKIYPAELLDRHARDYKQKSFIYEVTKPGVGG